MSKSIEMDPIDISGGIFFSYSGTGLSASSGIDYHSLWGVHNQPGPFHHEECWPTHTGIISPPGAISWIVVTADMMPAGGWSQFENFWHSITYKCLQRRGLPRNQLSTTTLSVQA